jgi:hypothetical protein
VGSSGRRRAWVAGAVLAAVLALALLAAGGGADAAFAAAPASSEATTSPTLTTTVLSAVTVHSGHKVTIRYRADDAAGGAVTVELLVTTQKGDLVRTLVHGHVVPAGVAQTWHGRITLAAGRYVVTAHAVDAAGLGEAKALPAVLVVLKALPPPVPTSGARRAAFAWAARRAGRVAVAVVDSLGRLYGYHEHDRFTSASVVKAMLLVAYLRAHGHSEITSAMRGVLQRMIDYSDNAAADVVYGLVGRGGLEHLAHLTGMKGFHATGAWISTQITAADMAFFFRDMHTWLPSRHRHYADWLLSHVTPYQSWGIPVGARPLGYRVYFKPGWLGAWVLANEAARLERGETRLGLAVFTDGNPASGYGKDTIAGVTSRLLHK